jgi:hypothetical protein
MMDATERELVRESIRHLLTSTPPSRMATELLDSGWAELLPDDAADAVDVLATEQGRAVVAGPAVDLSMQHALGLVPNSTIGVVLPPMRAGCTLSATRHGATRLGEGFVVDGLIVGGFERASWLVATDTGVILVPSDALEFASRAPADTTLGLHAVTSSVATDGVATASSDAWISALAMGRRALSAELVGLAEQMLGDTIAYVIARQQFGRPIGAFQTVKHRLADVRVAISAARAGLNTAWEDSTALSAMAAKALAGRAVHLASTHCHQVHGGIAFTVEHGFHRFIRRAQVLTSLLGTPDDLVNQIGRRLIDNGVVPRTPQLTASKGSQ